MGTHGPYLFKDETPCSESLNIQSSFYAFSVLTLLVGRQEGHPACKKQWWGAGVVVCLEQGADLHMVQLLALPLTVSCFSKIQIGFTFLVPAHLGSPGKGPLNVCLCVCVRFYEREGEGGGTRVVVTCRTSNEYEVSDGREHGRIVTAHFTRVVAAVFSRHICHHTAV